MRKIDRFNWTLAAACAVAAPPLVISFFLLAVKSYLIGLTVCDIKIFLIACTLCVVLIAAMVADELLSRR